MGNERTRLLLLLPFLNLRNLRMIWVLATIVSKKCCPRAFHCPRMFMKYVEIRERAYDRKAEIKILARDFDGRRTLRLETKTQLW